MAIEGTQGTKTMLTAEGAKEVLREMEEQVKSAKKRKAMAAFFSTNIAGKLSPEAIKVYKEYSK